MNTISRLKRELDLKSSLILGAVFILVLLFWNTPLVYPIKIFVVLLHELGHAAAALLTGGQIDKIMIYPNEGGMTYTRGGIRFIILSAGYTGSVLVGGVLLYLSSFRRWGQELMIALAALVALSTLLYIRNLFGLAYGFVAAIAMLLSARYLSDTINHYILRFVAVASCLYALLDIGSDLLSPRAFAPTSDVVNDAVALARLTHIPALFWAILWIAISLVALLFFFGLSARTKNAN